MKVLFIGDGSSYHANLAVALKAKGHDVTVASDGTRWMQTDRDIDLSRRYGKLGGALLWLRLSQLDAPRLRGYDVVQLSSPGFAPLRPKRLRVLLDRLKADNGIVCLTALGTDSTFVRNCLYGVPPALKYSEWQVAGKRTPWSRTAAAEAESWLADELVDYTEAFYTRIDGAVSALYEYHHVIETVCPWLRLAYGGIPIVREGLPSHRRGDGAVRVLHAVHRGREGEKGADVLIGILRQIEAESGGRVTVDSPDNVPYASFLDRLSTYDIVSDQLYSYTPATTALLAMSMGVVPVSGGEPEYYDFIGERELRPIINADPTDIEGTYRRLKAALDDERTLAAMSRQGPEFVARHNDSAVVADRFIDFWQSIL